MQVVPSSPEWELSGSEGVPQPGLNPPAPGGARGLEPDLREE